MVVCNEDFLTVLLNLISGVGGVTDKRWITLFVMEGREYERMDGHPIPPLVNIASTDKQTFPNNQIRASDINISFS